MLTKIFNFVKTHQADVVLAITIVLITITSYNLGRFSVLQAQKTPITIIQPGEDGNNIVRPEGQGSNQAANIQKAVAPRDPTVVASKKSSSKLYHFTWCPGAKQISTANKVTFPTDTAAIAAGYTLAGNCQK